MIMQKGRGRLINIRKLVALDILLHGPRFILLEYGLGTPFLIIFGAWLTMSSLSILGLYLVFVGIDYVPLLLYAIVIIRERSASSEVDPGLAHDRRYVRKYSLQQFILLIPLVVPFVALVQEKRKSSLERAKL